MSVLVYALILIVIAFLIHLIIWKKYIPPNQTVILLLIFLSTLIIGIILFITLKNNLRIFKVAAPANIYEYFQLCIFFISVSLAYIVTYSALEVDSPSLIMVMHIASAGKQGLKKGLFDEKMNDEILIIPRIRDLVNAGMICQEQGVYRLTQKGRIIVSIFRIYRRILRKKRKGG